VSYHSAVARPSVKGIFGLLAEGISKFVEGASL
jgi:hypothetical protein